MPKARRRLRLSFPKFKMKSRPTRRRRETTMLRRKAETINKKAEVWQSLKKPNLRKMKLRKLQAWTSSLRFLQEMRPRIKKLQR